MYQIQPYTQQQAKALGVTVRPSTNPKKKVDVYEGGQKIASIGDINYLDYPSHMKEHGKAMADERRRLYHLRHGKAKKGTPGYYASRLLW
jgi:hypothetical protein